MEKNNIVQNALEKYIINNTDLSPNYRRDAILLKFDLSYNLLEDILSKNNSYFNGIMCDSIQRAISDSPNENTIYNDILAEIEKMEEDM